MMHYQANVHSLQFWLLTSMINKKNWHSTDKTSFEESQTEFLASQFYDSGYQKATNILENSKSCIDLTFTSQPNMVMDSGVHCFLHSHWYHQNIYVKFNLKFLSTSLSENCQGWTNFFLSARLFGRAILLARPIGQAKKGALKTKVHVRSRHNWFLFFIT